MAQAVLLEKLPSGDSIDPLEVTGIRHFAEGGKFCVILHTEDERTDMLQTFDTETEARSWSEDFLVLVNWSRQQVLKALEGE